MLESRNTTNFQMNILYAIAGAGGFAREVMPLARECAAKVHRNNSDAELVFVVEDGQESGVMNGHRIVTTSQFLADSAPTKYFNVAIADSRLRQRLVASFMPHAKPFSISAATYVQLDDVEIGEGAIFCNYSHITSNVRIGRFFHCNIYSYVAHDCVIGDFVTLAPGVKCNGRVVVEDHAYIGTGAVIRHGGTKPLTIGRGAVVGMGAVVTKDVPCDSVVVGNPARVLERKAS